MLIVWLEVEIVDEIAVNKSLSSEAIVAFSQSLCFGIHRVPLETLMRKLQNIIRVLML